jgi:UDP-N-acetylglucosamine--N-acetylmuramyl-(pentapeptide) pyrophosphoryl-undecaprenol N-acetylglucosamine transferase
MPAMAVANALINKDFPAPGTGGGMSGEARQGGGVELLITTDSRGYDLVAKTAPHGAQIIRVWASGVGNRGLFGKLFALSKLAISAITLIVKFISRRNRPDRIVAFGGYSSVPAVLAGRILGVPTFLHEQNAAAGRANALSARFATKILTSFPETSGLPKKARVEFTGLPTRPDFVPTLMSSPGLTGGSRPLTLFITGGSLGAKILMDVVPMAVALIPSAIKKNLMVVQQVDEAHHHEVEKFYAVTGIKHRLAPFFKDMAQEMKDASLVIGRSGASTVVELMTIGRPAILVPLNINPDQAANARAFEKIGGGIVIEQKNFTPKHLSKLLTELFSNPARLEKMSLQALTPNSATENILHAILN